jgi:hypothetical protein
MNSGVGSLSFMLDSTSNRILRRCGLGAATLLALLADQRLTGVRWRTWREMLALTTSPKANSAPKRTLMKMVF